jgi:hypothetical protein
MPRTQAVAATFLIAAAALLTGCPQRTEVQVVGQVAPGRPVFATFGSRAELGVLEVAPCVRPDAAVGEYPPVIWRITTGASPALPLDTVVYGHVPPGYRAGWAPPPGHTDPSPPVAVEAPPLPRGCYNVSRDGTGQAWFTVGQDGSIRALRQPPQEPTS